MGKEKTSVLPFPPTEGWTSRAYTNVPGRNHRIFDQDAAQETQSDLRVDFRSGRGRRRLEELMAMINTATRRRLVEPRRPLRAKHQKFRRFAGMEREERRGLDIYIQRMRAEAKELAEAKRLAEAEAESSSLDSSPSDSSEVIPDDEPKPSILPGWITDAWKKW